MANRAYKFRIYPNDAQKILFARTFGCVRMVYNHWLDRKIKQYEENKANVTDILIRRSRIFSNSQKQVSQGSNPKSVIKAAIQRSASMET